MAELKGDAMLFTDVPEIADIPLTPLEFKYVTAYLSPECNMDMHKAYRMVLTDEAFKSMHRTTFYTQARQMAGREMVRKAISRLMTKHFMSRKEEMLPTLLDDLMLASSYDPAEVIDDDGDFVGGSLRSVPVELRKALIEGVSVKYWGKNNDVRTREVKLTNKAKARSQLIELAKAIHSLDHADTDIQPAFIVNIGTTNIKDMKTAEELIADAFLDVQEVEEE